ncbi:hypothetical protein CHUAL_006895 [Chamberlinius hualienensis]
MATNLPNTTTCDGCTSSIIGFRYKCIECPNFDLCVECEKKQLHSQHMMTRISPALNQGVGSRSIAWHPGKVCSSCQNDIYGFLYKCVQCKDYYLCFRCEYSLVHAHHQLVRFQSPIMKDFEKYYNLNNNQC